MLHAYAFFFFFFNDTATTEIYTLSLHDALPILPANTGLGIATAQRLVAMAVLLFVAHERQLHRDRKSTRLNSSHQIISYAVFCLKKKTKTQVKEASSKRCLTLPVSSHTYVTDVT